MHNFFSFFDHRLHPKSHFFTKITFSRQHHNITFFAKSHFLAKPQTTFSRQNRKIMFSHKNHKITFSHQNYKIMFSRCNCKIIFSRQKCKISVYAKTARSCFSAKTIKHIFTPENHVFRQKRIKSRNPVKITILIDVVDWWSQQLYTYIKNSI